MEQEIDQIMQLLTVPYEVAVGLWREFNPSKAQQGKLVFILED